ncbi:AAA family ATPase [Streptomyces cyaneofuscatus]|uniref:AAA family ATPase n=1 Tax=Streptomyces cyaneofuscatus TaxID=66883 RepID=UPI00378B03F6
MLIVMAALPGAGKSAVAGALGRVLPAAVVEVDPVEAAMWRAGVSHDQPTGPAACLAAEAVAEGVPALGRPVVIDAVEAARGQLRALAARHGGPRVLHRGDVLGREGPPPTAGEPGPGHRGVRGAAWQSVARRRATYEPWTDQRLVLDSIADLGSNATKAQEYLTTVR